MIVRIVLCVGIGCSFIPSFRRRVAPLPVCGEICNRASSAAAGNVHLGFEDDFELVVDDKGDGD